MHYKALVAIGIPSITEDESRNQEIRNMIENLKEQNEAKEDSMFGCFFCSILQDKKTSFARIVNEYVDEIMMPYSTEPKEEYLEFRDLTESLQSEFEQSVDCLKLPEGRIVELHRYPYAKDYCIVNGKVYQKNAGPLHHAKRTKKAKRIIALPNYPRSKIYKSIEEYAENTCNYIFHEEYQAYGYYWNPNAMWDWYQIGGRWPTMFLVKSNCIERLFGTRSWCNRNDKPEAPEGYIWVAAARKKDICWEIMREWNVKKETEYFYRLKKMFALGELDEDFFGCIVDDGIVDYSKYAYYKDETLEKYLERCAIPEKWKYPFDVHSMVDADNWTSKDDCFWDEETEQFLSVDWHNKLDEYVEELHDEDVLVGVDYHI